MHPRGKWVHSLHRKGGIGWICMRQTFGSTLLLLGLLFVSSACAKFNFGGEDLGNTTLNNSLGPLVFAGSCYNRSGSLLDDDVEHFCSDNYIPQSSLDVAIAQGDTKAKIVGCIEDDDLTFSESKCPTATVTGICEMTYSSESMGVIFARNRFWYPETSKPEAGKTDCEFFGTIPNSSTKWIPM
jgi:hypothetical protein